MSTAVGMGAKQLMDRLNGKKPELPVDEDGPLLSILADLEHTSLREFSGGVSVRGTRSQVRYLAALWPDASMGELVERVHLLVSNKNLLPDDIRNILNGLAVGHDRLSPQDVSLMLRGQYLGDASRRTREVPIQVIQLIGKCLREGMALRATSQAARCSFDTVEAIDRMLGLRAAFERRLLASAVDAARDGVSVRNFAIKAGVSKSRAHKLLTQARDVLREIGELP